jgi:glutamate-ammonia-ligase adenylyltransferase
MRKKMRESLATKSADTFDLKQSAGGIVDIEFIVQFGVLSMAHQAPEKITQYTDNIRLIDCLHAQGFISKELGDSLKIAYCAYRDTGHKRVLQGDKALIAAENFVQLREQVTQIWHTLFD